MSWRSLLIVLLALSRTQLFEAGDADFKCLPSEYTQFFLPQYVIVNEKGILDLSISTSSRSSHQIVSHLVHILLTEALGYQNVTISSPDADEQLIHIANKLGAESGNSTPDHMVDLEVWLPPGLSLDNLNGRIHSVVSAGPLGPVAQYGWFLRNATTDAFWTKRHQTIDHYRYWTNLSLASHFQTNSGGVGKADLVIPDNIALTAGILNATNDLINKLKLQVKSIPEEEKTMSTHDIIRRINKLTNLRPGQLISNRGDLLLLTWFPNVITARFPFQRISFSAPCSLEFDRSGTVHPQMKSRGLCDPFPLYQLTKWVWSGLKDAAPMAYSLIRNLSLSQTEYEALLKDVNTSVPVANQGRMYREIACEWLKNNNHTWQLWLPKRPRKVKMKLGGIFPSITGKWSDPDLVTSARNGVVFANDVVLKGLPYEIVMEVHNISCDRQDEALYEYNQIVLDKCGNRREYLLGVLAASCSASIEPMILLNRHYRTIIISPTVESTKFSQKGQYPFFFRTVPDMDKYASYLSETFKKFKWKRAALFRKDDHFVNKQKFARDDFKIVDDFETGEEQLKFSDVKHNLEKSKRENDARIFVVEYFEKGTSLVLCAASKLGMTAAAGYVWFLNPWIDNNFLAKQENQDYYREKGNCNLSEMLKTVENYFVLTHLATAENQSKYAPFVKDAVLVFAHALKNLSGNDTHILSRLNEYNISDTWKDVIKGTKFKINSSKSEFEFNQRQSRPMTLEPYSLMQYRCDNVCKGYKVGYWERDNKDTTVEESDYRTVCKTCKVLKWIGNKQPGDGSREEDNCFWPTLARKTGSCAVAIIVVVLIAFCCVLAIGVLLIIALRPHYKQLKEAKRQLAPFSDILNDLAPLEMKSFQIVLNLPLGEGAFGTVRGGEAKLYGQWHAVAVKTLHERATQEEKMEFLSEARIMKAFNHPNIVKLLGVRAQSKSEPYMTVMEFMLYGDMKKYLIARHVLAKEEPDHPDICPASLTSMTIDIVSGLEYLHTLGYIHRDLALRNCLVGNNRQVKLCDFGLTREVNDGRDYYRFERRGMLPVRWMAPESLHSGVFTIKSDIWSFGVVLYEIVTFGNKPYRDKRNEDVIDCMRLGNDCLIRYLNSPEERLPKLLTLMRECFHYHPHERPDSAHIYGYLSTDPCCVRPCLEEAPPDPGELPAGLLGPESGDRRRGGSGGGGGATDRIRFHSGARGSTSTTAGVGPDSVFAFDYAGGGGGPQGGLVQHAGLNSSFPGRNQVNGARPVLVNSAACPTDVRNYASSTEFIPMRPTRSLSGGLPDAHSPDNASPTTGLLETEISIGSEVDGLAACDYDTNAVTFSPFANGATPHSRASLGIGSSHGSLHSRLTHAS